MPTIDATVGGASSNAYLDAAEADVYFDNRLHASAWTSASADDKDRALIMATLDLDSRIEWAGYKASTMQALGWPRSGIVDDDGYSVDSSKIPDEIKTATCELALVLLGKDTTATSDTAGIKSLTVDTIKLDFDKRDRVNPIPESIMAPLRKWGRLSGSSSKIAIYRA